MFRQVKADFGIFYRRTALSSYLYVISTFLVFLSVIIITSGFNDTEMLNNLLKGNISDSKQTLLWLGILIILNFICSKLFLYIHIKSEIPIVKRLSLHLFEEMPKFILNFGSLSSGVLFATCLYLVFFPDKEITFLEFFSISLGFFFMLWLLGAILTNAVESHKEEKNFYI